MLVLLSTQTIALSHNKCAPSQSIYDTITKCLDLIGRNGISETIPIEVVRCLPFNSSAALDGFMPKGTDKSNVFLLHINFLILGVWHLLRRVRQKIDRATR